MPIIFLLIAIITSSPLYAIKFTYTYQEGEQYRFISHVNSKSQLNDAEIRESKIINRIAFKVAEVKDKKGRLIGSILSSEEKNEAEKNEDGELIVASLWSNDYSTDFWRDDRGTTEVDPIYYMPMVRGVPFFPIEDVEVGKKWVSRGEDVMDIRGIMKYNAPFHIPFTAFYEYKGPTTYEKTGEIVHHIVINYQYKANFPNSNEKNSDANIGDPLTIEAMFTQNVYWSEKIAQPIAYDETYNTTITFRNKDVYKTTGNANAYLIEAIPMDKKAVEEQLVQELKDSGLKDMKIEKTEEGVKIVLENIQFIKDSSRFIPGQEEKLQKIGQILSKQARDVKITGHTADTGKPKNEIYLSGRRALAVADYLVKNNYRAKESILTEGKGSTTPIAPNKTAEGREKNRRVEILIMEN